MAMQNITSDADFVVCLSLETTHPDSHQSYRRYFADDKLNANTKGNLAETAKSLDLGNLEAYKNEMGNSLPRIVHIDWTICSVKEFKVAEVVSVFVNPDQLLDQATQTNTGVSQEVITKEGVSFSAAIEKVSG